ncbi:TraR/DksA family transcriptional regulator [Gemmata sp.]|uniref:TraR/DksA family transcriptional regulator n=1 Tax=Gemmata sp. TaxID=1914242 RepID=UPI003F722817
MTTSQSKKYRDQLQALARRLGATVASLEEQVRTPTGGEAAGGISNAPLHLGDVGSEAYNQELGATLLENEAFLRDEVAAALERLDAGAYGTCQHCTKAIGAERLEALPYVRHCVKCASRLQSGLAVNMNDGRPDGWLGRPGHEGPNQTGAPGRVVGQDVGGGPDDVHAAGTPGGGTAVGGLAGTNIGGGSPEGANLEGAMGSGNYDTEEPDAEDGEDQPEAQAGPSGGAVGGTPANKRARGGSPARRASTPRSKKAK